MGEHAAVYGRPALVAAVDRRLVADLHPAERGVFLDLPDVGVREETSWEHVRSYTDRSRSDWCSFEAAPSARAFQRLRGADPAHVVKIALGETVRHLGEIDPPPLHLSLRSRLPIGGGFGSSAATGAAVAAGYQAFRGHELPRPELHALTLEIERRQHGSPSGIDNAAVIYGGLIWADRDAENQLRTEPIAATNPLLRHIQAIDTGEPGQPTGEVVAAVRALYDADPTSVGTRIDHMESLTRELRDLLLRNRDDSATLMHLFREFQRELEALGTVPASIRELVRKIEAAGGAAKISGAGALRGPGAGSLLVFHPEPATLETWPFLEPFRRYDLRLGAPGIQVEQIHDLDNS